MNPELNRILVCPDCCRALIIEIEAVDGESIVRGTLTCRACGSAYPIIEGIPRFVSDNQDYCENFGWQWQRFQRTQIDGFNGLKESETRFRTETDWESSDLRGSLVLDAGCGAGRFSSVAAKLGARVVAVDISQAVDACAQNMNELGHEVEVVQASIYRLPFPPGTFDRIFSLGVLQHTPDPNLAIQSLPIFLKPGGSLALWIYEHRWTRFLMVRNLLRHFTRRVSRRTNYAFCWVLVTTLFPLTTAISLVPGLNKLLPLIPISSRHYWGKLSLKQQWEWTLLDTFDSYSAAHEHCQKEVDVVTALLTSGMNEVHRTSARGMALVATKGSNSVASTCLTSGEVTARKGSTANAVVAET